MFRLVKFPGIKVSRPQGITPQIYTKVCSFCGINSATAVFNHNAGSKPNSTITRQQNTSTNEVFVDTVKNKKRFSRSKKFFTELLEVFGDTSKQTKATVKNLKPGDVSRLAACPNIELDHVHKIKRRIKVKNKIKKNPNAVSLISPITRPVLAEDMRDIHSNKTNASLGFNETAVSASTNIFPAEEIDLVTKTSNINSREMCNIYGGDRRGETKEEIGKHVNLLNSIPDNSNSPMNPLSQDVADTLKLQRENLEKELSSVGEASTVNQNLQNIKKRSLSRKQKTKEILAKEKLSDLEKKCREKSFNTTLYAYLSLCVSCNFLQRGIATLHYYLHRSKGSLRNLKITDVNIFEVLMQGFAAKGNQNRVNELWNMLLSSKIKPSLDVFAFRLECAARSSKPNKQEIVNIVSSLKSMGYLLNDIFVKCVFLDDQRDVILKAIQEVEPSFAPVIPPPSICYSCSLLQEINKKQGKDSGLRSPIDGIISKSQLQQFAEEQLHNEFSYDLKVKSIEKKVQPLATLEINRQKLDTMKRLWMQDLKNGFSRDVTILEVVKKTTSISLLPYMKVLDTQSYIDIMMKEVQRLAEGSETFSPSTHQLYKQIGQQVRQRYIIKFKKSHGIVDKTKKLYDKYCDWYLNPSINNHRSHNSRQEWQRLMHETNEGPSIVGDDEYWPSTVVIGIGKFLYNIIVGDVNIDVNILNKTNKQHMLPAFYKVYRQQGLKTVEEIKPHPMISKLYRAAAEEHILFDITQVPMLCPPLPWTSYKTGGYLTAKTDIIRLPDQALQQRQRLQEAPPDQLYPPLDSLNQLGSVPWRVNQPVLDTVIEVFNNGGSAKLEIPEPPHFCPVAEPVNPSMTKEERYQAYRMRLLLRRQKAEMYSLWCDALYKLSLANHFRDKIFWLPHNMDFRGRVYPCPPHLNHLGADMSRSLLYFAQGKPLGPDGLDWLKIHLVNLLGTKKRNSIQERLDYCNTIISDILDSSEKPLTGKKWWMESETPWQTLSCCMEIHAAMQHPSGHQDFISRFPVHQDGSCNGLQHYAALGRDDAGACSVNLMPQEFPQDVYSCVAALVERERVKDSQAGVSVAKELDGFVRRKVIKQTVMTTVYGVTRFGARLQIAKQLKDIDSFPKEFVWPASTYLVVKTFESLREMFKSTREIQDWFTECARLVSYTCGENMEYVTPLGLPVVQYYSRQTKIPDFKYNKLGHLQEHFAIDMFERPNVMKQKNAFPPNFIHSLDSSHMMLTSIFSEQEGITFVSVHDCYWTHPCSVHIMNQICRKQFVALHSQPILEDLSKFMLDKYCHDEREQPDPNITRSQAKQKLSTVLSQVPPKGSFLLENVLDSVYFFS